MARSDGRLGLLRNNVLSLRETLEIYRMKPVQTIAWVAKKAEVGFFRAGILALRAWLLSSMKEKRAGFNMQRIFRTRDHTHTHTHTVSKQQQSAHL